MKTDWFIIGSCRDNFEQDILEYFNAVEPCMSKLTECFEEHGLDKPAFHFQVFFGQTSSTYHGKGRVNLAQNLNLKDPMDVYGGLFHEACHGFLEPYGAEHGHWVPESWSRFIQHHVLNHRIGTPDAILKAQSISKMRDQTDDVDCLNDAWEYFLENPNIGPYLAVVKSLPSSFPRIVRKGSERAFLDAVRRRQSP